MKFTEILMDGAVALVTGGARGIGLAIAHRLAGMGARVMIADLDGAAADEAAREVGSGARGFVLDVTEFDEYLRVVTEIEDSIGPVDIVVNNAGIMPVGPLLGSPVGGRGDDARQLLEPLQLLSGAGATDDQPG